jgi:hypothetical protein
MNVHFLFIRTQGIEKNRKLRYLSLWKGEPPEENHIACWRAMQMLLPYINELINLREPLKCSYSHGLHTNYFWILKMCRPVMSIKIWKGKGFALLYLMIFGIKSEDISPWEMKLLQTIEEIPRRCVWSEECSRGQQRTRKSYPMHWVIIKLCYILLKGS